MIIGLLKDTAFNGDPTTNPFNFQHFNIDQFSLYIEGESYPTRPYTFNFNSAIHGNFANAKIIREFYDNCPIGEILDGFYSFKW
jgi:hypothetical protein